MRTGGTASFNAEHKRKPFLSYFIHKKDEVMEAKRNKAFLPIDEFVELVHFKFGIPLIVLDFLDYVTGSDFIYTVQKFVNPQIHIERFNVQDNDFNELKSNIDDEFLPYTFQVFNALGNIDLHDLGKNAQQEEREAKQYLTLESIKRNLPKVFGIKNDFFAEMLFSFISDHAPLSHVINYHQFLSRL